MELVAGQAGAVAKAGEARWRRGNGQGLVLMDTLASGTHRTSDKHEVEYYFQKKF